MILGNRGQGAIDALNNAGLKQIAGITGNPDDAVKAFLAGTLKDNPDAKCDHHHGEHNLGHSENTHAEQPVFTPVK